VGKTRLHKLLEIEPKVVNSKKVYPNFKLLSNQFKIIKAIQDSNHILWISKNCYEIGNGYHDFVDDCYNTKFKIWGSTLEEATFFYLTLYIKQTGRCWIHEKGDWSEWVDTSHTLTREHCYYPESFDDMVEDSKDLLKALKEIEWDYSNCDE